MSLFDNFKDLPDDTKISLGDKGELTLAQLRELDANLTKQTQEIAALSGREAEWKGKFDKLSEASMSLLAAAGKSADDADTRPPADPKQTIREAMKELLEPVDPSNALYEDKLFGAALTKAEQRAVSKMEEKLAPLLEKLNGFESKFNDTIGNLTRAQLSERAERWYATNRTEIPTKEDGKRMSLAEINDYAVRNRIVMSDAPHVIDFDGALERLTAPMRQQTMMTEAEKRGYEKGLQDGRSAAGKVIPMFSDRSAGPNAPAPIKTEGKSAKQIVNEAISRGLQDIASGQE